MPLTNRSAKVSLTQMRKRFQRLQQGWNRQCLFVEKQYLGAADQFRVPSRMEPTPCRLCFGLLTTRMRRPTRLHVCLLGWRGSAPRLLAKPSVTLLSICEQADVPRGGVERGQDYMHLTRLFATSLHVLNQQSPLPCLSPRYSAPATVWHSLQSSLYSRLFPSHLHLLVSRATALRHRDVMSRAFRKEEVQ